ncbi:MAG: sigma-54 dependent transcriptional regulator [Bacteroidota bacterium]
MSDKEILSTKQRFGIIGNSPLLDRCINIAMQVASTDLTVLITGESGTGKEVFPKIIHQQSARKHGPYIAVNCGAIPEGTIDSELFGHEKGSFTGAHEARKGYFEVMSGGTIFLDEVAELPLTTQVRLLRVLETGEFIRVGSSKVQKTNVRLVAATNINLLDAISRGRFREDLYYRLNAVPILIPPLRERPEDILLIFRKFASDFAEKNRMPSITLTPDAQQMMLRYRWSGNIRQLKNVTEQISVIEQRREIGSDLLFKYLPDESESRLPVLLRDEGTPELNERELLYKVLFEMRRDINDLKKVVFGMIQDPESMRSGIDTPVSHPQKRYSETETMVAEPNDNITFHKKEDTDQFELVEESLSLQDKEIDMIRKALEKHKGRRRNAARELGISERTLYRKINEHSIK